MTIISIAATLTLNGEPVPTILSFDPTQISPPSGTAATPVRQKLPSGMTAFYVGPAGATYLGAAPPSGTAVMPSTQAALENLLNNFDFTGQNPISLVTIQLADSWADSQPIHFSPQGGFVGAQGGWTVTVQGGNNSAINNENNQSLAAIQLNYGVLGLKNLTLLGLNGQRCLEAFNHATIFTQNVSYASQPDKYADPTSNIYVT